MPATWFAHTLLSGRGGNRKLLILTYHRVLKTPDELLSSTTDMKSFEWQMALLSKRFTTLPLTEAVTRLRAGTLPPRALCITFDDGYADNVELALPLLRRFNLKATFFITSGFLDGGRMWNDTVIEGVRRLPPGNLDLSDIGLGVHNVTDQASRRQTVTHLLNTLKYLPLEKRLRVTEAFASRVREPLPADLMMTRQQLLELQVAGMEIGAHTVNHPILTQLDIKQAEQEIRQSRERLLALGIREVQTFAYPNGGPGQDYNARHVEIVRNAGFEAAVSTAWGCARRASDVFQLPRIAPWDATPKRYFLCLMKSYLSAPAREA